MRSGKRGIYLDGWSKAVIHFGFWYWDRARSLCPWASDSKGDKMSVWQSGKIDENLSSKGCRDEPQPRSMREGMEAFLIFQSKIVFTNKVVQLFQLFHLATFRWNSVVLQWLSAELCCNANICKLSFSKLPYWENSSMQLKKHLTPLCLEENWFNALAEPFVLLYF